MSENKNQPNPGTPDIPQGNTVAFDLESSLDAEFPSFDQFLTEGSKESLDGTLVEVETFDRYFTGALGAAAMTGAALDSRVVEPVAEAGARTAEFVGRTFQAYADDLRDLKRGVGNIRDRVARRVMEKHMDPYRMLAEMQLHAAGGARREGNDAWEAHDIARMERYMDIAARKAPRMLRWASKLGLAPSVKGYTDAAKEAYIQQFNEAVPYKFDIAGLEAAKASGDRATHERLLHEMADKAAHNQEYGHLTQEETDRLLARADKTLRRTEAGSETLAQTSLREHTESEASKTAATHQRKASEAKYSELAAIGVERFKDMLHSAREIPQAYRAELVEVLKAKALGDHERYNELIDNLVNHVMNDAARGGKLTPEEFSLISDKIDGLVQRVKAPKQKVDPLAARTLKGEQARAAETAKHTQELQEKQVRELLRPDYLRGLSRAIDQEVYDTMKREGFSPKDRRRVEHEITNQFLDDYLNMPFGDDNESVAPLPGLRRQILMELYKPKPKKTRAPATAGSR